MFELASALFSIADANEFRFARFYIVCEAVPLGAPESPLIVCGLSDTSPRSGKTWPRHEKTGKSGREEILAFCSKESSRLFFTGTPEIKSFNEQQRFDEPLSPAACLSLSQLFVLYEHLFDDALAVGADFLLRLFIQLVRIDRLAVL